MKAISMINFKSIFKKDVDPYTIIYNLNYGDYDKINLYLPRKSTLDYNIPVSNLFVLNICQKMSETL
jgi:hypothetical protein